MTCLKYLLKIEFYNGLQLYLSDHYIDSGPSSLLQDHSLFLLLFFWGGGILICIRCYCEIEKLEKDFYMYG